LNFKPLKTPKLRYNDFDLHRATHCASVDRMAPARVCFMAEFDPDQLGSLMVEAFELLGKPPGEARELAIAILKAAERPQSDHPGPDRPQG
jgi:hypothetical protein